MVLKFLHENFYLFPFDVIDIAMEIYTIKIFFMMWSYKKQILLLLADYDNFPLSLKLKF